MEMLHSAHTVERREGWRGVGAGEEGRGERGNTKVCVERGRGGGGGVWKGGGEGGGYKTMEFGSNLSE